VAGGLRVAKAYISRPIVVSFRWLVVPKDATERPGG
jgi:hypothetical protein